MLKVIFACVHNAGRSQMAAAFFNHLADPRKHARYRRGRNRASEYILKSRLRCGKLASIFAMRNLGG